MPLDFSARSQSAPSSLEEDLHLAPGLQITRPLGDLDPTLERPAGRLGITALEPCPTMSPMPGPGAETQLLCPIPAGIPRLEES